MEGLECLSNDVIKLLLKNDLLNSLITKKLIDNCIHSINITEKDKQEAKQLIISSEQIANEEDYVKWINNHPLKLEDIMNLYTQPQRINRYSLKNFKHMTESRFLKRKEQLDQVTYSLLRVKDEYLARELYFKLVEKESDFGTLSNQYSLGPEKNTQGIIGPIPLNQAHPNLVNCLQNSQVNIINPPIKIDNVYLICRLESMIRASLTEEMELQMSKEIFYEWLVEKTKTEYAKLISKFNLKEKEGA